MIKHRDLALIALVWIAAAFVGYLTWAWPAFAHVFGLELFPIGCAVGWFARISVVNRRERKAAPSERNKP